MTLNARISPEALATLGLLICAAGMVAHGLALPKRSP